MAAPAFVVAFLALFASFTAVDLFSSSLDHQLELVGPMTPVQAVQALLPLAAMWVLLAAVTSTYHKLRRAAAAAAGTEVPAAIMCAAVGLLVQLFVCEPAAEAGDNGGARAAEELGMAAAHVLPAAATATFFLGLAHLFVRLRAGDGAVVAGEGAVQILVKIVLGATAVLVGLMLMALAL